MTTPPENHVPIEQLLSAIEKSLESGPRYLEQLARELGCSPTAVRRRLLQLESDHRAHRVRVKCENSQGVCYLWHHGVAPGVEIPEPVLLARELPPAELRVIVPHQVTVRSWPAIRQGDGLVAALFGLVQQSAA